MASSRLSRATHEGDVEIVGCRILQLDVGESVTVEVGSPGDGPRIARIHDVAAARADCRAYMSQPSISPVLLLRSVRSELPSPLRSPVPTTFQAVPGFAISPLLKRYILRQRPWATASVTKDLPHALMVFSQFCGDTASSDRGISRNMMSRLVQTFL